MLRRDLPSNRRDGPRGAAAAPSDLASLLLDLRLGAADLYQDAARTTAAVSGDPVGGWKDTAAAAHHLSQSTSARRPIYYSSGLGGGARPRVSFDGVDDGLLMSGWGLGSGAQTVAMEFVRRGNVPTAQRLFSVRVAGPIFSVISLINYGGYNEITALFGSAGGASVGCNPTLGTTRHTLVVCYNGSGSTTSTPTPEPSATDDAPDIPARAGSATGCSGCWRRRGCGGPGPTSPSPTAAA